MFRFLSLILIFFPLPVSAHGIGEVYALPVPLDYYLIGAAIAVAFSFFVMAIFFGRVREGGMVEKTFQVKSLPKILSIFRILGVLLLVLTIATGLAGTQVTSQNFAPVFFWVYFLIGFSIASAIVGNIWEKLNPWKTLTDWMNVRLRNFQISGFVGVVLLLMLFWFELVSGWSYIPRIVSFALFVYTVINILASQFYANWYKQGEVFSVLFGFIGQLAHLKINDDNSSLSVTHPRNKFVESAPWWVLGIAAIMLAGASFDSLQETAMWYYWLEARGWQASSMLYPTLGIILAPIPFLFVYFVAVWLMKLLVGSKESVWYLAKHFVWSLIPIAFGYTLAHNFSLFVVLAPVMLGIISDPFGLGWNLFGTADFQQANLLLGAKTVWFIEIGLIVLAHVVGVWYAHVLALKIFPNAKLALRSQYPLLILMVGFTVLTLWLISQPLVIGQ